MGLFFETDFQIIQYLEIPQLSIDHITSRSDGTKVSFEVKVRGSRTQLELVSATRCQPMRVIINYVGNYVIYTLQFGAANNFYTWRLSQIDCCSIEFGFQANVMKNNVIYVPPAVVAADYTPAVIEGEPALTAALLATLRLEAEKQRNKEVHQLKLSKPKYYATLCETMSIESKEGISQHA